jgi:hypothetical protein
VRKLAIKNTVVGLDGFEWMLCPLFQLDQERQQSAARGLKPYSARSGRSSYTLRSIRSSRSMASMSEQAFLRTNPDAAAVMAMHD